MKQLLLLLLLPSLLFAQVKQARYKFFPCEYDGYVVNPNDSLLYSVVTGKPVPGAPKGIKSGSGSLHTAAFIDANDTVWVIGDNLCNISGLGLKAPTLGMTKTKVGNAKQVVAYANSGDPGGLGYGEAVVTYDGKLILLGNSQSGFRNDGTAGNQAEPGPYLVPLPKPVAQVAVGSVCFARFTDGSVYSWGGTIIQYYNTYVLGRGVDNPDATHAGLVAFPEPIVDIQGGAAWMLAIGQSGAIYGTAYNTRYLGLGQNVSGQNKPFNLTKTLGLPATPVQIAVGPQASYALMPNGDGYAWGDNTQAAIGNGQEAIFSNFVAPWGGGALWVDKPVKINPTGVVFDKIFASVGDAFYVYYEDTTATLWNNGRNKGFVLWNGKGGTSAQQSAQPNLWDVLAPTKISGFGTISAQPLPPVTPVCPACPPVVVCPPPVVCPVCPPIPAPRTVTGVSVIINGQTYTLPISSLLMKFTFNDGTSQ